MNPTKFYELVPRQYLHDLIAEAPSPCYLLLGRVIRGRVGRLRETLDSRVKIHFAMKANPNPDVLRLLKDCDTGVDVASAGELNRALNAGFIPGDIEFSGPGKSEAELELAISAGIGAINTESVDEISLVAEIARRQQRRAKVGLRINPNIAPKGGLRMAGSTQFGIAEEHVERACATLLNYTNDLEFVGLHLHLGSQILDADAALLPFRTALPLCDKIAGLMGMPVAKVNFGGGWGVNYFDGQNELNLDDVCAGITTILDSPAADGIRQSELIIEPGRYLVAEAGVYVTRVLYRKSNQEKNFLIVDGGMHHNYLLAGGMGQVIRRNFHYDVFSSGNRAGHSPDIKVDVAGCLCTPQDVLLRDADVISEVDPGDCVAFFNCGSYGSTASPNAFLGHEPATEVFIPA